MAIRRTPAQIEALVLDLLSQAGTPLSAYMLARRATLAGHVIVPNQIYRTLTRLNADGRVKRLETLGCYMLRRDDAQASLICRQCHSVTALTAPDLVEELVEWSCRFGFIVGRAILETQGVCARCRPSAQTKP